MPNSDWRIATLGEVADVSWGDTSTTKSAYLPAGYVAYSATGPDGFLPGYAFDEHGIVVSAIGAQAGRTWLAKGKWSCIKNTIRVLATSPDVHVDYLYWATRAPNVWPIRGSAQPFISQADARGISVRLPSYSEQRAIAEVLGALDDKIVANTKLAETSDELVHATFVATVQMDTEYLPLFDVVTIDFGEPFKGTEFSEEGIGRPLIRIRDLKSFRPQTWTTESRPREVVVKPGDIVIGMDAEFRATPWLGEPGLLNQRVCRARSAEFGAAYLREALRAPLAARENEKSATTVIHLNKGDLERSVIAVPNDTVLRGFEAFAEPLFANRVALAQQNRTLASLRDTLLPELISGRLRVKDAEKKIEEVV